MDQVDPADFSTGIVVDLYGPAEVGASRSA
jgi:hypothetical protein